MKYLYATPELKKIAFNYKEQIVARSTNHTGGPTCDGPKPGNKEGPTTCEKY